MKKNETSQTLILNCKCSYSYFVEGCYNLILACHFYRDYKPYKNLSYPFIIEGDLKRKGTKFMIKRPDLGVIMFYEIVESTITDYYSRFKYHIYKTIPDTFEYTHQIDVYYLNEDECLILSSLIYNNKIYFSEKDIKDVILFKRNLYKTVELCIRNYMVLKISTVYTVINTNIELIWNIIRNMKIIHKYAHLLSHNINYKGKILKKDQIIQLINKKGKKEYNCIAKVNKCKMIKSDLTKECIIEFLFQRENEKNKENIVPFIETKIIIRIYEFKGKCSIYILYFFFNALDKIYIENFTEMKYKELRKFKRIVEYYKDNIKNIENIFNDKGKF